MHNAIASSLVLMLLLVVPLLTQAQEESPLVVRIERTIKNLEPNWRYVRGIQSGRVPRVPTEKTLVTSLWERKRKNGKRENVSVNIYEVSSAAEARTWLNPGGKRASDWQVENYQIGDEAYLSNFKNGRRFALQFRKNNIVVEVSGDSPEIVMKFAEYVVSGISAS